ncbi:MAG: hypothetical protein RLZ98_1165, partial [Pseudomonadota bacterium]
SDTAKRWRQSARELATTAAPPTNCHPGQAAPAAQSRDPGATTQTHRQAAPGSRISLRSSGMTGVCLAGASLTRHRPPPANHIKYLSPLHQHAPYSLASASIRGTVASWAFGWRRSLVGICTPISWSGCPCRHSRPTGPRMQVTALVRWTGVGRQVPQARDGSGPILITVRRPVPSRPHLLGNRFETTQTAKAARLWRRWRGTSSTSACRC